MKKNHLFFTLAAIAVLITQNLGGQETRPWFQDGPFRIPKANP